MSGWVNLRTFALKARLFPIFRATKLISWDASPSQVIPLYLIAFPKQFGRSAGTSPDQQLMSEWYLSVWPKNANQASVQARSLWFYGSFGSWKTWRLVEFVSVSPYGALTVCSFPRNAFFCHSSLGIWISYGRIPIWAAFRRRLFKRWR